ncbi:hypothetical protein ACI3ER_12040 [Bacillus sp. Wb]
MDVQVGVNCNSLKTKPFRSFLNVRDENESVKILLGDYFNHQYAFKAAESLAGIIVSFETLKEVKEHILSRHESYTIVKFDMGAN